MGLASEYRNKTRRELQIPSGITIQIRQLSLSDFLECGEIPTAFVEGDSKAAAKSLQDPALFEKMLKTSPLACVVGPGRFRIVDKASTDCGEDELAISELGIQDLSAIVEGVVQYSGMTKEAAEEARPFRPE